MGLPVEVNNLMLGSLGGYTVSRSLRFRASASAYLNRTPASAGNRTTWTWSGWYKRSRTDTSSVPIDYLFDGGAWTGSGECPISFYNDTLNFSQWDGTTNTIQLRTTQVFRDPAAWYHIVVVADTTQATASNRIKMYVNGVQITAFSIATYPSLNYNTGINTTSTHAIGRWQVGAARYLDGYLAEVNFIDGQALTPSSFGAYDTNGVWQPKKYTGTYGTNGFYLPFSNTTSTTTLVADSSGNGNNWTANNISLTAGTTYDSMIDSPTVSASSSNYAVLNPLRTASSSTVSNGNLSFSDSTNNHNYLSTIGMTSGKWYFEFVASASGFSAAHAGIAISTISPDTYIGSDTNGYAYHATTGQVLYNNSALGTYSTWTSGDVIGIAYDADGGKLYVAKNNTWQNSGNPAAGTGAVATGIASNTWFFGIGGNPSALLNVNFGQQPFTYTPPSGFKALNTYNLPAPSIANGAQYMAASLWTGDATTPKAVVSNLSFSPDFVWIKDRSVGYQHSLQDIVRGTGASKKLYSSLTEAENGANSVYGHINSFDANGFTVATGSSGAQHVNANGVTYVGWSWKAGGTAVTNNSGTISSQVSANTSASISILTYSGNGTNGATVGHGLGVKPDMVIIKGKSGTFGDGQWIVQHKSLSGGISATSTTCTLSSYTSVVFLNLTNAAQAYGFDAQVNGSSGTYVAYCFSAVRGFSAFGSYTGNGSTDGPFVFTNFRPRYLLIKRTDAASDWRVTDSSRSTYNAQVAELFPSSSAAETSTSTEYDADYLSNGFKLRSTNINSNASGGTYIYMAFAENPFNSSRAR